MNYYISNKPGGKGSNANSGLTTASPWLDFTPVHQLTLRAGDRIMLERGSCWNQQLTIVDSGDKGFGGCAIDAWGQGPLPKIIRNGDPLERCIVLKDVSYWRISNVEVGHAGVGILVLYETPMHESLRFDHIYAHHCYGIFVRDMLDGPARTQARVDCAAFSAGIMVTSKEQELTPEQYVCKGISFDYIEGCHNGDSIAVDPFDGSSIKGENAYAFQDVSLNHLYLHDDDGPNPGGIPDSLRLVRSLRVTLMNSRLDHCCGQFTTSGTAMVFFGGVTDVNFTNNAFTRTPDSGSVDQCAIDFEGSTRQVKLRNNFFGYNAGPGVEFLDIWGEKSYSEGHEVAGNAFEGNGWSTHGGQAGSGGIHHYGGNFATGIIRDNVVYEPDRPLYHGEFVNFQLKNNLQAKRALANSINDFYAQQGYKGWHYQVRTPQKDWSDLPYYDAARQIWTYDPHDALVWISRFEQFASEPGASAARAWVAPEAGAVSIRGRALKTSAGGAKVRLQITLNDKPLWSVAECLGQEREGYEAVLDGIAVAAGDVIRFEVSGPAGFLADGLSWAPTIAYMA
ncbi:MAG: hypothetical protein LLG44_14010 [Chloroflexi bacterium]|nr:hypothetical protein [Chloroflexota bacterium]